MHGPTRDERAQREEGGAGEEERELFAGAGGGEVFGDGGVGGGHFLDVGRGRVGGFY